MRQCLLRAPSRAGKSCSNLTGTCSQMELWSFSHCASLLREIPQKIAGDHVRQINTRHFHAQSNSHTSHAILKTFFPVCSPQWSLK